jgi:hypothetical protein
MTIRLLRLLLMPWIWCRESQHLDLTLTTTCDVRWHIVIPTFDSNCIVRSVTMLWGGDVLRAYPLVAHLTLVLLMQPTIGGRFPLVNQIIIVWADVHRNKHPLVVPPS